LGRRGRAKGAKKARLTARLGGVAGLVVSGQLLGLGQEDEGTAAVLAVSGFIMARNRGAIFTKSNGLNAAGVDTRAQQFLAHGDGPALSQGTIVFLSAAFVTMPFDANSGARRIVRLEVIRDAPILACSLALMAELSKSKNTVSCLKMSALGVQLAISPGAGMGFPKSSGVGLALISGPPETGGGINVSEFGILDFLGLGGARRQRSQRAGRFRQPDTAMVRTGAEGPTNK